MGVQENFNIIDAKWCILRPFSVFLGGGISFTKLQVLRSWVNRFWKDLSVVLSDDSIALWTAVLRERNAER